MSRPSSLSRLADLAQEQWGLVTRQQAELAGLSPATVARLGTGGRALERVARGVYHLKGAPLPDHLDLRAAWLALAPEVPAWERTAAMGVVSHRSAASLYALGHLPADRHEFTVPERRRSRRPDVIFHWRRLGDSWICVTGLPVTRPHRIASDLLYEREDPEAIAQIVADAIRNVSDYPGAFAGALSPHAARYGLRRNDGAAMLRWLLDLSGDREKNTWLQEARASVAASGRERKESGVVTAARPA